MISLSSQELADLIDTLAAVEHQRWAHWQSYLHAQGEACTDGSIRLSEPQVRQWEKQIATPYEELSEREKESDREQVLRYLPLLLERFSVHIVAPERDCR